MKRLASKLLIIFVFAGVFNVITACSPTDAGNNASEVINTANLTEATFTIENMTCATCPITVRKAMRRVEGVYSVKVDFKTKQAHVSFDPALTTADKIAAASTEQGYPATEVKI